jgi:hypothetical protein
VPPHPEFRRKSGARRLQTGLHRARKHQPRQSAAGQEEAEPGARIPADVSRLRAQRVITYAGYILGFPNDTPERIARDIRTVQQELPVDLLEFFILTPLPGSADHQALHRDGAWMDPDMNKYDLEHVTTGHPVMTSGQWQAVYRQAWDLYYSAEHIETIFRRAKASGIKPVRLLNHILQFYFTFIQENVHPLQGGYFRRKLRRERRAGLPHENPLVFYPRRVWEVLDTHVRLAGFYLYLHRIRRRVERDPSPYTDPALAPVDGEPLMLTRQEKVLTGAAA